jgi:mono/diheme cytochrome c family protein
MTRGWLIVLALAMLCGCEKLARNMYDGAREKPLRASPAFADGNASRPPLEGTIERTRGILAATSSGRVGAGTVGERIAAERADRIPYPITRAFLERGRQRFDIFCSPCHSIVGDGDGWVARRGFPHPPSYHTQRLRAAPDRHFYDVMTNGYGIMYSYADRVAPEDRWAIVAYIRALQLSQHARREDLQP